MKIWDWIKNRGINICFKIKFWWTGSPKNDPITHYSPVNLQYVESENKMETKLELRRTWFTDKSTIGELTLDDKKWFTLEDTVRKNGTKIYGKTAIPKGIYEIVLDFSPHFKKFMPHLLNVPSFEGIRIHSGNKPEDTEGCILVGLRRSLEYPDLILDSQVAFKEIMEILEKSVKIGQVFIDIY